MCRTAVVLIEAVLRLPPRQVRRGAAGTLFVARVLPECPPHVVRHERGELLFFENRHVSENVGSNRYYVLGVGSGLAGRQATRIYLLTLKPSNGGQT